MRGIKPEHRGEAGVVLLVAEGDHGIEFRIARVHLGDGRSDELGPVVRVAVEPDQVYGRRSGRQPDVGLVEDAPDVLPVGREVGHRHEDGHQRHPEFGVIVPDGHVAGLDLRQVICLVRAR